MTIESFLSILRQAWEKRPPALRFLNLKTVSAVVAFGVTGIFITFVIAQGNADASAGHDGGHEGEESIDRTVESEYPIVTVRQPKSADTVQVTIEAAGQVFAEQQADLYPLQDGIIQSLSANLGSRVGKGQVLALLRPDQSQQELIAEIAFKRKELEIAKKRASLTIDSHLRTTEEEREAELNRIDAEIVGLQEVKKQTLQSMRNAGFDLLESVNEMLFTRSDGIADYLNTSAYDYYRRPEIFPGFGSDFSVREKFEYKLLALKKILKTETSEPVEIASLAMAIGQEARQISLRISETPAFPGHEVDRIRKEIGDVTDHLSESTTKLAEDTSELASLEAEKRKIRATTEREIVDVRGGKQNADLDAEIIEAEIVRLQQQVGAGRTIVAPFSGIITKRYVNAGESVTSEKPVFNLINNKSKYVRFNISESDLSFVRIGTTVNFSPTSAPSEKFIAVIKRIAEAVDPDSGTIQVEADIPAQDDTNRVLAQMTIRVQIPVTQDPSLLVIPEAALQLSKDSSTVWTVKPNVTAEAKKVEVMFIHGGYAYIKSGITAKDWIVVKSPVELSAGLEIDTKQP
ncbi:efflux RND transporter periplasmic adaptor subunit [Candidatus Peribacteria bacterium]|nr:efflux RND transporter periplasmic adaptor subunit [Candidatus Peribacteria bacterium]